MAQEIAIFDVKSPTRGFQVILTLQAYQTFDVNVIDTMSSDNILSIKGEAVFIDSVRVGTVNRQIGGGWWYNLGFNGKMVSAGSSTAKLSAYTIDHARYSSPFLYSKFEELGGYGLLTVVMKMVEIFDIGAAMVEIGNEPPVRKGSEDLNEPSNPVSSETTTEKNAQNEQSIKQGDSIMSDLIDFKRFTADELALLQFQIEAVIRNRRINAAREYMTRDAVNLDNNNRAVICHLYDRLINEIMVGKRGPIVDEILDSIEVIADTSEYLK